MDSSSVSEQDIRKKFLERINNKFENIDAEWRNLTMIIDILHKKGLFTVDEFYLE